MIDSAGRSPSNRRSNYASRRELLDPMSDRTLAGGTGRSNGAAWSRAIRREPIRQNGKTALRFPVRVKDADISDWLWQALERADGPCPTCP